MNEHHAHKLAQLFLHAPIQAGFPGIQIHLAPGSCSILAPVRPEHFHGGMALHGSVYFKMLDDAAYFACATLSPDHFLVTASFEIRLLQPVTAGILTATGTCTAHNSRMLKAAAVLRDEARTIVAEGSGTFVPTATKWDMLTGYRS